MVVITIIIKCDMLGDTGMMCNIFSIIFQWKRKEL